MIIYDLSWVCMVMQSIRPYHVGKDCTVYYIDNLCRLYQWNEIFSNIIMCNVVAVYDFAVSGAEPCKSLVSQMNRPTLFFKLRRTFAISIVSFKYRSSTWSKVFFTLFFNHILIAPVLYSLKKILSIFHVFTRIMYSYTCMFIIMYVCIIILYYVRFTSPNNVMIIRSHISCTRTVFVWICQTSKFTSLYKINSHETLVYVIVNRVIHRSCILFG